MMKFAMVENGLLEFVTIVCFLFLPSEACWSIELI